jgi:hypothetical protein
VQDTSSGTGKDTSDDEENQVDSGGESPVEDGDDQSKDGGEEEETHGVAILLPRVVEGVLATVLVDLLRNKTEQSGSDSEEENPDDELIVSFDTVTLYGSLTYPSIRPDLKILENSKCRLTVGSRAAAVVVSIVVEY